jgi:hypothetical protein
MKPLIIGLVIVVILLHQDFWLWKDRTLVFGFLPIGLAYHGAYAIVASLTMALMVRFLWPSDLEEEVEALQQAKPTHSEEAATV